jgi:uncharacterized protein (TIGR03067 family)
MTATHPTNRELGDFLLGKLNDPAGSGVESHLAECNSCRDRAVAVQADDTFTELLAAARTRFDSRRASAPTPTLDGTATPPAFAPTLAWSPTPGSDATRLAPEIPAALAGHPKYHPIRRLGTGGMGTVWLAEHQVMHRPVAIKVIRPDLLTRPGATGRFLREVRAAAKLHHSNIVTAFDADPAGDSYLMVMEYVPGETLGERLESGPLPMVEALRAVRDAARGLAHAHAHGLIHRDIKPHNLIRSADGATKVLDFGLAGVAAAGEGITAAGDGLTGAGMVVGTPDYIAPEQITNPHAADARADIYGLGCTLYHLLTGRSPMPDGSVMEKLAAQRTRPMDPIPGLPTAVAAVLAKMTAKEPKDRYQAADEVVAALERCIRMMDPVRRRRRRRLVGLAAGVLFLVPLVTAGVVFKIERDNEVIEVKTDDPDVEVVMKRKGTLIRIIDTKTGTVWNLDPEKNEIGLADSPEGLTLQVWDGRGIVLKRNGKEVFTITRTPRATAPAVAKPDDTPSVAPRLVRTVEEERRFPQTPLFTPDGKALLVAGYDYFAMYDPATGKELFSDTYQSTTVKTLLAVSADGRTAAVACGNLFVYDLAGRKRVATIDMEVKKFVQIDALTLSPDGQRLAYVAGPEVVYYDRSTGQTEYTRPDDDKVRVFALRYSPDGRYLAVASRVEADQSTRISLLDAKTRELVGRHETTSLSGATLQFSRDNRQLFVAGIDLAGTELVRRTFLVLGVPGAKEVERELKLPAGPEAPVPSPDSRLLALNGADGTVQVWDRGQMRVTFAWNPHTHTPPEFRPPPGRKASPPRTGIAFAPDGRTLATARGDQIRIWELAPAKPKSDHDFIQGTWRAVSGEPDDVIRFTPDQVKQITVTFAGDTATLTLPGARHQGTFSLDQTRQPKHMTITGGPDDYRGQFGIYQLDSDTLRLCMGDAKMGRPSEFGSQVGDRRFVNLVLKREPAARPDCELILGTWRGVAAEVDGQSLPREFINLAKPTLIFTPDKVVGKPQGTIPKSFLDMAISKGMLPKETAEIVANGAEGVYHIDPGKVPKEIDFTILGAVKRTGLGIYQLDGDALKVCLSIDPAKVSERPREFAAKATQMRVLLTLRRLTPEEVILEDIERRIDPANTDGKSLPFALLDRHGVAAIRFSKWLVVFEGVPCDSHGKVLFGVGAFFLPETGGRGNFVDPGLKRPAPALRQQSTGRGNMIAIERYEFQLESKGTRLKFADKTYEATDRVQTIVIAPDGTTRLEPPPKK